MNNFTKVVFAHQRKNTYLLLDACINSHSPKGITTLKRFLKVVLLFGHFLNSDNYLKSLFYSCPSPKWGGDWGLFMP